MGREVTWGNSGGVVGLGFLGREGGREGGRIVRLIERGGMGEGSVRCEGGREGGREY